MLFEVADQNNPDPMLVVLINTRVSAVHLLIPTKCGLDFAIAHSVAVTDHKVISDTQPVIARFVSSLQVRLMDALNAAAVRRCVMNNQILPIAFGHSWLPRMVHSDAEFGIIR